MVRDVLKRATVPALPFPQSLPEVAIKFLDFLFEFKRI